MSDSEDLSSGSGSGSGSDTGSSGVEPANRDELEATLPPPKSAIFELGAAMEKTRAEMQSQFADYLAQELYRREEYAGAAAKRRVDKKRKRKSKSSKRTERDSVDGRQLPAAGSQQPSSKSESLEKISSYAKGARSHRDFGMGGDMQPPVRAQQGRAEDWVGPVQGMVGSSGVRSTHQASAGVHPAGYSGAPVFMPGFGAGAPPGHHMPAAGRRLPGTGVQADSDVTKGDDVVGGLTPRTHRAVVDAAIARLLAED